MALHFRLCFFSTSPKLAKDLGWSSGKVYGSVLKVKPVEWFEFLTTEEIEEFKKMDF